MDRIKGISKIEMCLKHGCGHANYFNIHLSGDDKEMMDIIKRKLTSTFCEECQRPLLIVNRKATARIDIIRKVV